MIDNKKQLGQFFTKKSDYILTGFSRYVKNKKIVDPFAGGSDLIFWARKKGCKEIVGYDVDKNYADGEIVFLNDSINNPLKYEFVLTNPPYLHKNKAGNEIKSKYFNNQNKIFEDLYQISISSILNCEEGVLG